jgi:hypothetical protein
MIMSVMIVVEWVVVVAVEKVDVVREILKDYPL